MLVDSGMDFGSNFLSINLYFRKTSRPEVSNERNLASWRYKAQFSELWGNNWGNVELEAAV